jgi:hypothetical protein
MPHTLQYRSTDAVETVVTGPCMFQGITATVDEASTLIIHDSLLANNPVFSLNQAAAGTMQLILPEPLYFSQGITLELSAGGDILIMVLLA